MTEVEETQELETFVPAQDEYPTTDGDELAPDDEDTEDSQKYLSDEGYYTEGDPRRLKLMAKPKKKEKTCGVQTVAKLFRVSTVPAAEKMSLRMKSKLDLIKSQIPMPEGAVPRTALPSWYDLSMNEKIPLVNAPKSYIYYTRGKLGNALHRCHPFFSIYDNRNLERVVGAPYSALHDPHAKEYLRSPLKRDFLIQQGLINEQNEVLCSLKDFNKFRNYLRTQYNDEVQRAVTAVDQRWKCQKDEFRKILKVESHEDGQHAIEEGRHLRAIQIQKEALAGRMKRMENKQRLQDQRMVIWSEEKTKQNLEKIIAGYERAQRMADRLYFVRLGRREAQRKLLKETTLKDIEVMERRKSDRDLMERATEKFKIEWLDSKLEHSKKRVFKESKLEEAIRKDIQKKAQRRQRRVEYYRTQIPVLIEKKKQEEVHLWEIVRKYAMRWLEKVRRRLHAPKDVQHESVWIGKSKGVLDDTLKYLKEVSGYEKMDDFVLNIIKLKKQIQHQIEVEEAQEAAEAEAAAKAAAEAEQRLSTDQGIGSPKKSRKSGENSPRKSKEGDGSGSEAGSRNSAEEEEEAEAT